jgi:peptidyl-prolyl cis-trans isomerase D
MSVLQTMRDKAGTLLAVVIGISLLGFILGDFLGGSSGNSARAQQKYYELAEIDGEKVSYQDFDMRVQNLVEIYKISGTTTITEEMSESLREQIWEQIVEELVLGGEIDQLGIGVSSEEVESLVLGNEPHPIVLQLFANQETGQLERSFLVNFLKTTEYDPQAKAYWLFFEDEIVTSQTKSKLNNLIAKGLYVTGKQVEYEKSLSKNSVDFSFVMKSYSTVADSAVTITAAEIEKYYTAHRDDFKQEATRDMEYVEFEVLPSAEDIAQTEKSITDEIEEFSVTQNPVQFINLTADTRHFEVYQKLEDLPEMISEFIATEDMNSVYGPYVEDETYKIARLLNIGVRPDSTHARHILISPDNTSTREMAKAEADSLLALIKGGANFESIAIIASDDQGSAQLGGDLGWFTEGQMVTPFNNACFENKRGDIVIAETSFGFHIIEILDQSRVVKKYHVGIIDRSIEASSATYQNAYSEASKFAGINNTYEKFNATIAEGTFNKKVVSNISPDQKLIAGLESPRYLVMSLFESKANTIILDRSEQAVFELGNKFIIAYCTGAKEAGFAQRKDVESDIRYVLLNEKKAAKIIAEFNSKISGLNSIEDISSALGLTVQEAIGITFNSFSIPSAGIEPAVISTASNLEVGSVSKPVEGASGVFIIAVNSVNETPQFQTDELLKSRLISNYQMRAVYEAFLSIRNQAEIVDKRYKFY